jgi:glycosyltransferase involved in cell wall biosynthesis
MKILIGCLFFRQYTGSELYCLYLAKELKRRGFDVTVAGMYIHLPITSEAAFYGIKVVELSQLTGDEQFDIIHCQHKPVTEHLCQLYPTTPKVATIHSIVYDLERPVKHDSIKHYVAIAKHEREFIITNYGIPSDKVSTIYNPVDSSKFNKDNTTEDDFVLLAGTVDYMRKQMIYDASQWAKDNGKRFVLIGYDNGDYLSDLRKARDIIYYQPIPNIEMMVKSCYIACGLFIGRTTIEAWMCGKSVLSYKFNASGGIVSREVLAPPSDIDLYSSDRVAESLITIYNEIA